MMRYYGQSTNDGGYHFADEMSESASMADSLNLPIVEHPHLNGVADWLPGDSYLWAARKVPT